MIQKGKCLTKMRCNEEDKSFKLGYPSVINYKRIFKYKKQMQLV